MSEIQNGKQKSLRIAAPALYDKMVEVFEQHNIHPYDTRGTVMETKAGMDVTIAFASTFTQSVVGRFSHKQVKQPDAEITEFFEKAAKECKTHLITDYYKMVKP
ncbi:hypothetical protein [Bacillus seohaeanensis]|uniref:Uncharacterized protein n=1 Tax=Bacillus seohaeanensis TaxID=284580 RepID=A0ABW5RUZ5_9BACI